MRRADSPPRRAPLLGIELRSKFDRPDQVAEQYRQMPPLTAHNAGECTVSGVRSAASSEALHCEQNLASSAFANKHFLHCWVSGVAHWLQYGEFSELLLPHLTQRTRSLLRGEVRAQITSAGAVKSRRLSKPKPMLS